MNALFMAEREGIGQPFNLVEGFGFVSRAYKTRTVRKGDRLKLWLAPGGGAAMRLHLEQ